MKKNIKKLALIIFFFNNSFKIFSSLLVENSSEFNNQLIQQQLIANEIKKKRQRQREEAQAEKQKNQLIFVGSFILLYIIADNLKWQNTVSQDKKPESAIEEIIHSQDKKPEPAIEEIIHSQDKKPESAIEEIIHSQDNKPESSIKEIIPGDNIKKYLDLAKWYSDTHINEENKEISEENKKISEENRADLYIYILENIVNKFWNNKQIIEQNIVEINSLLAQGFQSQIYITVRDKINLDSIFIKNESLLNSSHEIIKKKKKYFFNWFLIYNDIISIKNNKIKKKIFDCFKNNQEKIFFFLRQDVSYIFMNIFDEFRSNSTERDRSTPNLHIMRFFYFLFYRNDNFLMDYFNDPEDKKVILQYINIGKQLGINQESQTQEKFAETIRNLQNFCSEKLLKLYDGNQEE